MITDSPGSSLARQRGVWSAVLLLAAACLALELFGGWSRHWLSYDRHALEMGQFWRLLTGNFVHLGSYHLMLNVLGLLVLLLLCPKPLTNREWLRRLLCLSLGVTLGLYFLAPQWSNYVGLSGVIHGLFVLGLVPQAMRKDRVAIACLVYLIGKLGWEMAAGTPVSDEAAIGGRVVLEAHLFGTLTAVAYGLGFKIFTRPDDKSIVRSP